MTGFIRRTLDPADRLGEVLFGLIMALAIIGAVRVSEEAVSNRSLLIAILGCNLAWALVDGVMYVLVAIFERGRKVQLIQKVQATAADDAAVQAIREELDPMIGTLAPESALRGFYGEVLKALRGGASPVKAGMATDDLLGGGAVALLILLATVPILIPFLLIPETTRAVRIAEFICVALLFMLGFRWGRIVGTNPWKVGAGLTLIGLVLVAMTVLLGG